MSSIYKWNLDLEVEAALLHDEGLSSFGNQEAIEDQLFAESWIL